MQTTVFCNNMITGNRTYLILLLLTSACLQYLHAQQNTTAQVIDHALRLKSEKNCQAAIPEFEKAYALLLPTANERALTDCCDGWADCLLSTGKIDSALLVYIQTIKHGKKVQDNQKVMYAYSVLGEVSRQRGLHRQAVEYNLLCTHYCRILNDLSLYSSRLSILGSSYFGLSMLDSAFYYIKEAVRIKTEIRDTARLPIVYAHLAGLYQKEGQLGESAEAYLQSLHAAETAKNDIQISNALGGIADVLVQDGHLNRARPFAERALLMFDTLGIQFYKANVLKVLAAIEAGEGNIEKSSQLLQRALAIYQERNNKPNLAGAYLQLTRAHLKLGDLKKALDYANLGLNIARQLEFASLELDFKLEIGRIYEAKKDWKRAGSMMEQALQDAIRLEQIHPRIKALQSLANISKQQGRFEQATRYLEETAIWSDTLHARQQSQYVQQLEAQYKRAEQDAEIGRLGVEKQLTDTKLNNSQTRQKMLIIASLFAMIAACLGFFLFYQKQKNAAVLSEKNAAIETTLQEKELLLREIHHRVKNNLQVISSLLNLQSKYIKDKNAVSAVINSQTRVRSMALIHQNLYQTDNLTGVNVKAYFSKLLAELFDTYKVDHNKVILQIDIDDMQIDVDAIIPIGLIINELVSNSLKYAFPDGQAGTLEVLLKKNKDGLLLEVTDSGTGFSKSSFQNSDTFGFKLIKSFATKLEATINIQQKEGKNTIGLLIPSTSASTSTSVL